MSNYNNNEIFYNNTRNLNVGAPADATEDLNKFTPLQEETPTPSTRRRRFNVGLTDNETEARNQGYLDFNTGVQHVNQDEYSNKDITSILGKGLTPDVEQTPEYIDTEVDETADSSRALYLESLGTTQYADLRRACHLKDTESFTDYYNKTDYVPEGYEKTAKLLLAEEKVKRLYADYKSGKTGYADFLYEAYGKDILKSQGYDFSSKLYWYNKAKNGDFSNPLDSDTFLSDILSMADQKFQAESWYSAMSTDNLKNNALTLASGGEITAESLKSLFSSQIDLINEHFESIEKFIALYKAGYVDLSTFNPFIDTDQDGMYDYYLATDGKLYAVEGSSGVGTNKCRIVYEDKVDDNGNKVVDRVITPGLFGTSDFAENVDSFLGSFFSVFSGLIDFGAQAFGLVGHWFGNDDNLIGWNAFKNNNLFFGGSNTKDFEGFQGDEWDDWARGISSGAGTILGMIASAGIVGVANTAAKSATTAASSASANVIEKVGAKALQGTAWAMRTYSGLRGGNLTAPFPKLAQHAIANRWVTAAALALRDGVSTANKLYMQNESLPADSKLTEGEIIGRTFANIGINTVVSGLLRAVGDSGVSDYFSKRYEVQNAMAKALQDCADKTDDAVRKELMDILGKESLDRLTKTFKVKLGDTIADIAENIITQTATSTLSMGKSGWLWDEVGNNLKTLTLNPSFILTNLYIAKQDMGLKFFSKTTGADGKTHRTLSPHLDDYNMRLLITSSTNMVELTDKIIQTLLGKYSKLVDSNSEQAKALMDGLIRPAMELRNGTRDGQEGDSILNANLKALVFLCKNTVDIPAEDLGLTEQQLARLTPEEKAKGGFASYVMADLEESLVNKAIGETTLNLLLYEKMYNQFNNANINILKGEYSLRQAYETAQSKFESFKPNSKGQIDDGKGNGVKAYSIDKAKVISNQRLMEAFTQAKINMASDTISLSQGDYDRISAYLQSKVDQSTLVDAKHDKTMSYLRDNLVQDNGGQMSYLDQLNTALAIAGLKVKFDKSILKELNFVKEAMPDDYNKISSTEFDTEFKNAFKIIHVENDKNGKFPPEIEKLLEDPDSDEYRLINDTAQRLGYSNPRDMLVSTNVIMLRGENNNAEQQKRALTSTSKFSNCLKVLESMGLLQSFTYETPNSKEGTKIVYFQPNVGSLFDYIKTEDALLTTMKSVFALNVKQDADIVKSGINTLLYIYLRYNASLINGKDAKSYVPAFKAIQGKLVDDVDFDGKPIKVMTFDIPEDIKFLENESYKKDAQVLAATILASLASDKNEAISRLQLRKLFDTLGLDVKDIDTSGNEDSIKNIKDYLLAYEHIDTIVNYQEKLKSAKDDNSLDVSPNDLKTIEEAIASLQKNPTAQDYLVDDHVVGREFFTNLENVYFFTEGRLEDINKNLGQESLGNIIQRKNLDSLGDVKQIKQFVDSLLKVVPFDGDVVPNVMVKRIIAQQRLISGSKRYDKRNLIVVNLARLETAKLHGLVRELSVQATKEAISYGSQTIMRRLSNQLGQEYIYNQLKELCRLQTSSASGILTFDITSSEELNNFKNLMYSLGYKEVEVDSMIKANRSLNIPGVSFTADTSRGFFVKLNKDKYRELISKSKVLDDETKALMLSKANKIDIKTAIKDRYGLLLDDEAVKNLDYDTLKQVLQLDLTKEGISSKGSVVIIEALLKLGKLASKLDKDVRRVYHNSYSFDVVFKDLGDDGVFGDALSLLSIIEAARKYKTTESNKAFYTYSIPTKAWNKISDKTKALYDFDEITDSISGMSKIVVKNINPTNWTLDYITKNFTSKDSSIDLRKLFLLPYNNLENVRLSEITYGYETIKVGGLDANGVNFLDYIRGQNSSRFTDVDEFKEFITSSIKLGKYTSEQAIQDNLLDIIKSYITKHNDALKQTLKSLDFDDEDIKVLFDSNTLNIIAERTIEQLGEANTLNITRDNTFVLDSLDFSRIVDGLNIKADTAYKILKLLRTLTPADSEGQDIYLLSNSNPYTDVATMLRYNAKTGEAFISIDDLRTLTKEQFEILEQLDAVDSTIKQKLTLLDKYDNGSFKEITDDSIEFSAQRTYYEHGNEVTSILAPGQATTTEKGHYDAEQNLIMNQLLVRSERLKLQREQDKFFKKLSSVSLSDPMSKWLNKALNIYTTHTLDNAGSAYVANMENSLAVSEMLTSIYTFAKAVQGLHLKDNSDIDIDDDTAVRLALQIYCNTTGSDMSSSYARYTLVYQDANTKEWHIENVGENMNGRYAAISLGRGLALKGLLSGKLNYSKAFLFNASKNVMAENATSYGENIGITSLNLQNINYLRNQIFQNCLANYMARGNIIDIKTLDNKEKLDIIAKELGAGMSRSEVRTLYMQNAKTAILKNAETLLQSMDGAQKQILLNKINAQADKMLSNTLETVENLSSASNVLTLKQQVLADIDLSKGMLTDREYNNLMSNINTMVADTIDGYTYFLNSGSVPAEVLDIKQSLTKISEEQLNLLDTDNFKMIESIKALNTEDAQLAGLDIKRRLSTLSPEERLNAVANILQYRALSGNRGKNIQFALLGTKDYLQEMKEAYERTPFQEGRFTIHGSEEGLQDIDTTAQEYFGEDKLILSHDLENFYKIYNDKDNKIYSIGFALYKGSKDLKYNPPVKKYRIIIHYNEDEVKDYLSLATDPEKKSPDTVKAFNKYKNTHASSSSMTDFIDGEIRIVLEPGNNSPEALLEAINNVIFDATQGKKYALVGYNSTTDKEKIKAQLGPLADKCDIFKATHIDVMRDIAKQYTPGAKINITSLALEKLRKQLGDTSTSHDELDDAMFTVKYAYFVLTNQVDVDRLTSSLYKDIDDTLNYIDAKDLNINTLLEKMCLFNNASLQACWNLVDNTVAKDFKNTYAVYGKSLNSSLLNELLNLRNMVQNSDEIHYIYKRQYNIEHEILTEKQSAFLSWLNAFDSQGTSNLENFLEKTLLFVEKDNSPLDITKLNTGVKLMQDIIKSHRLTDKSFSLEDLMQLPVETIQEEIYKHTNQKADASSNLGRDYYSQEDLVKIFNDVVNDRERFQDYKLILDKQDADRVLSEVYKPIFDALHLDDLDKTTSDIMKTLFAGLYTGSFEKAFTTNNEFVIKYKGPRIEKTYYLDHLTDLLKEFDTALPIQRDWVMASGSLPLEDITLEDGSSYKFKSTDIGITRQEFQKLFNGVSVESYKESLGLAPDEDIYIQFYRNPGVGSNVIHTYRVKIVSNNYNKVILAPDIFAAYHGGDFDSDKIMLLKPDKVLQKYGKALLSIEDKVWGAGDKLINYISRFSEYDTDKDKLAALSTTNYTVDQLLKLLREGYPIDSDVNLKQAVEFALKEKLIKQVDPSKYPTLKSIDTSKPMYYSEYSDNDKESDEIIRRLAMDTKFLINSILTYKDSGTGFSSKTYKKILDGLVTTTADTSELFTYNQFALCKQHLSKLKQALATNEAEVLSQVLDSFKGLPLGYSKLVQEVKTVLTETFKYINAHPTNSVDDLTDKAEAIVNTYRLFELYLRHEDTEFKNNFNITIDKEGKSSHILKNMLDDVDKTKEQRNLKVLQEYAKFNGINLGEIKDIDNLSMLELRNYKYNIAKALQPSLEAQGYFGSGTNSILGTGIVNAIRAQIDSSTNSSINYIDGTDSKNYVTANFLIAGGKHIRDLAPDVLALLSNRHVQNSFKPHRVDLQNLNSTQLQDLYSATAKPYHTTLEITDDFKIPHGTMIISFVTKNGKAYNTIFDKQGNLIVDLKDIAYVNTMTTSSMLNSKLGAQSSGALKGTIGIDISQDLRGTGDIFKLIQSLDDLYKTYNLDFETIANSKEAIKNFSKDDVANIKQLLTIIHENRVEKARLTEEYANERARLSAQWKAHGESTWDELAEEYAWADDNRRAFIRNRHRATKAKYESDIVACEDAKFDAEIKLAQIYDRLNLEKDNLKNYFEAKHKLLDVLKRYKDAMTIHNKEISDARMINLQEKLQLLGIDTSAYTNLTDNQIKHMTEVLKTFDYLASSNLYDPKKMSSAKDGTAKVTYYDDYFNEVSDASQASYTVVTARAFNPEANKSYANTVKETSLDEISLINDRTNLDTIVKHNGKWLTKNADGTFTYDSTKDNKIVRIINSMTTPFATPTNATRIYRTLLIKALYENCAKVREEFPDESYLLNNLIQGTLTSGNIGTRVISYIITKMEDKEFKALYNSSDKVTQFLLQKLPDFLPKTTAVDAEEFENSKLISKNKNKELERMKNLLYYYTKPEGFILEDQNYLQGKTQNGYSYVDVSEIYYPLQSFVQELAQACGVKDGYLHAFKRNAIDYTLLGKLNFVNGSNGTQDNNLTTKSYIDCVPYVKKSPTIAGIANDKAGDVPYHQETITPNQGIVSQYASLTDDLNSLLAKNSSNHLDNGMERTKLVRGDFLNGLNNYESNPLINAYNDNIPYYQLRNLLQLAAYGADSTNRLEKALRLTTNVDNLKSAIAPRYFGLDSNKGITFTANPQYYSGTYGDYEKAATENLYGHTYHETMEPLVQQIKDKFANSIDLNDVFNPEKNGKAEQEQASIDFLNRYSAEFNPHPEDTSFTEDIDTKDLNYILGNKVDDDSQVSPDYPQEDSDFDVLLNSLKASGVIKDFATSRLASSNIKDPGVDRAVVSFNANLKSYRNQLLGKEFKTLVNLITTNKDFQQSFNNYIKYKNMLTTISYCNEKLSKRGLKEHNKEFWEGIKSSALKELGLSDESDLTYVNDKVSKLGKAFYNVEAQMDILCNRVYEAAKAYYHATGQTCPSRETFFLPTKVDTTSEESTASLLFAGVAKYSLNPFALRKETTGLNPSDVYKEFDALTNIVNAATQIGRLQALLTYREELKVNGAMSNSLAFDETCKVIGDSMSLETLNNSGTSDPDDIEMSNYSFFENSAKDLLGVSTVNLKYANAQTSCARYGALYNHIYQTIIEPLRDDYGDISFHNLLQLSMANPQDQVLDRATKAYCMLMDIVGKITTIQIERGEPSTLTDKIYNNLVKYAEDHDYALVDQFGREYNKDLSQFKALSPYATDDYIFRVTHGELRLEGTYEQNVALDALRGDLYFMNKTVAKHTQSLFYTRERSTLQKIAHTIKNVATKLIMANPMKFPSRMLNFSMFDLSSSLASGNWETVKFLPQITKEIGAYLQSNGEYCPEGLAEFIRVTGVDPLKDQVLYGEGVNKSKSSYLNFVGKQYTAQHIANRYALYLAIKSKLESNNNDVSSIYSMLGNSYYLKDKLQELADNMNKVPTFKYTYTDEDGNKQTSSLGNPASSRIAAFIVSNAYGTYGDMPGFAGSMSKHGFMFTTFPMALVRFASNEIKSGATAIKELFTGTADTSTLKWLGRQMGGLASLAAITIVLQILPALLLSGEDEDKKDELMKEILENDASLDLFSSILLDDAVYNTSTVWNPYYGVKKIVADPLINAIKGNEDTDEDKKAMSIIGDSLAGYFNQDVWNKLHPAITLIPNSALPQNKWTNTFGNQGTNFFDNLSRKALAYSIMGYNGANAFANTMSTAKYDEDRNFFESLGEGFMNSIREELGNSKSYKSSWKNYTSALNTLYDYRKHNQSETYSSYRNYDQETYSGLKAQLKNAMKTKASPSTIYNIVREALNNNISKEEVKKALSSVSVRLQIQSLNNPEDFYNSLTQKEFNSVKSALAYEDTIFPNLDELFEEAVDEQVQGDIARGNVKFFQTNRNLKTYSYNYPTYRSSNYKTYKKNTYYNNTNNWNTNSYSKSRYNKTIQNPSDVYDAIRNKIDYGVSTDIYGTQTQYYKDGTSYTKRERGFNPLAKENK